MIAELPIRNPTRLPDYDYSTPGAYFVTICCQNRKRYFDFPPARAMVESVWQDIPNQFSNAEIDIFIVMPDHFHGIILLKSNMTGPVGERPRALPSVNENGKAQGPSPTNANEGVKPARRGA